MCLEKKYCLGLSWHALNYIFNAVRDSHQKVVLLMIFSVSSAPSSHLKTSLLMINHTSVALGRSLMCKGCYCPPLASTAEGRKESRRLKEDKTTLIFFFNFQKNSWSAAFLHRGSYKCVDRSPSQPGRRRSAFINLTEISVSNRKVQDATDDQTGMHSCSSFLSPLIGPCSPPPPCGWCGALPD